jgi:hypothetical protein
VVNELDSQSELELKALMEQAQLIFWIEPGTPQSSAKLIQVREAVKDRFQILAPCPHQSSCGLVKNSGPHWCHFFAVPPNEVFRSSFWSEFSKNLGIDLRSLPTSFLILSKSPVNIPQGFSKRLLGRARHFKGYSSAVICEEKQVSEQKILKRENKELIELLKKNPFTFWLP